MGRHIAEIVMEKEGLEERNEIIEDGCFPIRKTYAALVVIIATKTAFDDYLFDFAFNSAFFSFTFFSIASTTVSKTLTRA